jgi:hypothetical protein
LWKSLFREIVFSRKSSFRGIVFSLNSQFNTLNFNRNWWIFSQMGGDQPLGAGIYPTKFGLNRRCCSFSH